MDIILYLLNYIQYQHQQICWLLNFICRYIPLKQWAFDDSHSPKYQKFKIDKLPVIKPFIRQDWQFLLEYYQWKYGKPVKPVQRRHGKSIPEDTICPLCGAPHHYIYDNNGGNGQYQCKVCGQTFSQLWHPIQHSGCFSASTEDSAIGAINAPEPATIASLYNFNRNGISSPFGQ